ncbi:MAG: glycoside hydrolase family 13 protein [Bacteroidota bacterium]
MQRLLLLILGLTSLFGCMKPKDYHQEPTAFDQPPAWAESAIWYQIFVERFRNGDASNDPRPQDMYSQTSPAIPKDWQITPWGQDWYQPDPWMKGLDLPNIHAKVQLRRYGGDLQGVMDQLDYLSDLGINAIYFNPLNDAPSLHKYDARNYRHIDRNFGPDPDGDAALMAAEDPLDPSTWQFTAADQLFLALVDSLHARGMHVIMDYSWNHSGTEFWAFQDLKANGEASPVEDWYHYESLDDPSTPDNEFRYAGWMGVPSLPEFAKDIQPPDDDHFPFEGNLVSPSLKEHLFAVTRRWLDPDGDGDPRDGVDGYRLDVAAEVPQGFWRDYRRVVRETKPDAYLVGEVWWYDWPDSLLAPQQFLAGDQFDAVMNYRWYRNLRGLMAQAAPVHTPSSFVAKWEAMNEGISDRYARSMMNVAASHDVPRLSTSLFNPIKYKYMATPSANSSYLIHKPDAATRILQKLLLVQQFTFVGAPHIWNGDELGMWGGDDPDCRKPIIWPDLKFEVERAHFEPGRVRPFDVVKADEDLLAFYRQLTRLRRENSVLSRGELEFLLADDARELLAYRRYGREGEVIVIFNLSEEPQVIKIPTKGKIYRDLLATDISHRTRKGSLELGLNGGSVVVLGQP